MSYRANKLFLPYLAMEKSPKIRSCDLDLWPITLKFNRLSVVANSALDFGQLYRLWSRTSLEQIKQSTSGKRRFELRFFPRSMKSIWWTLVHLRKNDLDLWPMILKLNRFREVVKVHVRAKYHQAECSGSWVIVLTNFFALARKSEKSENPAVWRWPLTYDLEITWVSCGCQDTCSWKISSS